MKEEAADVDDVELLLVVDEADDADEVAECAAP